jgi:crotonobetainyl-CoA:carnitine CoA-transferase CaiB-like acyl-CoA transferase
VNRNKRICTLDLGRDEGREVFLDLVRDADVVISNFRTKVLPDLRIGYDDLVKVNPGIIVLRMPAFGTTGPYKDAAGYGPIVEGMGGLGARFGYDDEGASISDLYFPDPIAGTHAALAVLSAIEQRERTGHGSDIDFSHMDVTWFTGAESIITAAHERRVLGRMGNREPGVACSGIVATRDDRFVAYVGPGALKPVVATAATTDAAELVDAFARAGGKATIVNDAIDGMADPGLADRFEVVDHPVCGPTGQLRSVFTVDGRPTTTQRPAPIFDQHTDEVMTEIGYRPERIIALREDKVIGGSMPRPSQLGR